jgi:hypothetical protein
LSFSRVSSVLLGVISIIIAIFVKEFSPMGWTTSLIWGSGKDARIPRWIGASFYFIVGVILIYLGLVK